MIMNWRMIIQERMMKRAHSFSTGVRMVRTVLAQERVFITPGGPMGPPGGVLGRVYQSQCFCSKVK